MNVYRSIASQNPDLIPPADPDLDLSVYTDEELRRLVSLEKVRIAHNAEISLYEFYRDYAWPAVEGDKPFVPNWHLEAIADHLEAVTAGDIKRLVINVPFRTSKSTLVSVAWPAWTWLHNPNHQWLCGSFASRLAIRDALKMRRLIMSPAYQRDFGDRFKMSDDQNQKIKFENDKGGYRIAFGFTGGVMGDGGDCAARSTLVQTEHGLRQIGQIVGDATPIRVWSTHPKTKITSLKLVTKFYRRPGGQLVRIGLPDGQVLEFTPNHLFLTQRGWVAARDLSTDDVLPCSAGPDAVNGDLGYPELGNELHRPLGRRADCEDISVRQFGVGVVGATSGAANTSIFGHAVRPRAAGFDVSDGRRADAEAFGKLRRFFGGLRDEIRVLGRQFAGWRLNADPLRYVFPHNTAPDGLNLGLTNPVLGNEGLQGVAGAVDFHNLGWGELRSGAALTSGRGPVGDGVAHVHKVRAVLQVAQSVVEAIAVKVANFVPRWRLADKGAHDGLMHQQGVKLTVSSDAKFVITTPLCELGGATPECGKHLVSTGVGAPTYLSGDAAYSPEVGDFVGRVTGYLKPLFIDFDGHADETFCLDVEDNHTFNVTSNGIVVHNCVLIDDPQDRQGANSDAERETTLTTFDEAITTRLNDPATSPIVIIMQRLHQNDLSGHVLKNKADGWQHLMLPMEYEPQRACSTSIGFKDPRTHDGELLWPQRFPAHTVKALTRTLGSYGAAGQLQQRPAPAGGGIYKVTKFRMWPASKPLPDFFFILQSADTAFTAKTENDPTGFQVWGIFEHEKKRQVMLLDCWNEHLDYPALKKRVMDDWGAKYGGVKNDIMKPARKPDEIIIEEKGSGISLIQDLRRANVPVFPYNPGRADKVARAYLITPIIEGDVVWVMESKREPGRPISWARPMLTQLEQFPNGEHDEMSDCISQALARLRDLQQLDYDVVPDDEIMEKDYHAEKERAVNPYA